jgi:hypothetical protein
MNLDQKSFRAKSKRRLIPYAITISSLLFIGYLAVEVVIRYFTK